MINKLCVREFTGLHLIHLVEIVAGWPKGQYNVFSSIETAKNRPDNLALAAVLCEVGEMTNELLAAKPAAVFICHNLDRECLNEYIEAADRLDVPLILLKSDVSLKEMRDLLQFAIKLKLQFNPAEYEGVSFLLSEFAATEGPICDLLSVYFSAEVILLDTEFQQIDECPYGWDIRYKFQAIDCIRSWYQSAQFPNEMEWDLGGRFVYVLPLIFRQSLLGYLSVLGLQRKFQAIDCQVLRQAGRLGLQNLLLQKKIEDVKSHYKDNFVYDLLYNNFKSGYDLAQAFQSWGIELSQSYQLFVLQPDEIINREKEKYMLREIERLALHFLKEHKHYVISLIIHEQVVVIFNCPSNGYKKNDIKKLAERLKQFLNKAVALSTISLGVGRFYAGVSEIYKSYEEAKQALILAGFTRGKNKISHFEDLGIMALLAQLDKEKLNDYNQMIIGKLIRYDKRNETNYLRLLQIYFEHDYNLNTTAKMLFMHANTVRNHLKKIEEILDVDLQNFNDCLQIYLACKTYWIVNLK